MQHHRTGVVTAVLSTWALLVSPAFASRPLGVDDANIDDKGTGHVEAWFSREARGTNVLNLAPAYSPWEVAELTWQIARNRTANVTANTALARVRLTESRSIGCNFLAALGHQRAIPSGHQTFGYTAVTCNGLFGSLHGNLGGAKASGASSYATWGIALERNQGEFVGHVEALGREGAKPTFQVGARKEIAQSWQLDGSVGRTAGDTIFSVGVKFDF